MATITLNVTEARNKFLDLVREAKDVLERVIITKNGKPEAVLMSYEEFEGWLETIEIMKDPKLAKELKESMNEAKNGKLHTWEEVFGKPQKSNKQK